MRRAEFIKTVAAGAGLARLDFAAGPETLTIGLAQTAEEKTFAANGDKIVRFIAEAKLRKCRVVVFPEGNLSQRGDAEAKNAADALERIREAARKAGIYVVFGGQTSETAGAKALNWLKVVGPDGREVFHYDKLYDRHEAPNPGVFLIDGIPCGGIICADRWLRGVEELPIMQGARISFELSHNFAAEWVPQLQWYWYAPRAMRNGAYVVFSNGAAPSHGHSAIVGPDGVMAAAVADASERLLVHTIDTTKATRSGALARLAHPVYGAFWKAGIENLAAPPAAPVEFQPYTSPEVELKIAGAQMACSGRIPENVAKMRAMIRTAAGNGAQLVAFPELAVTGARAEDVSRATETQLAEALGGIRQAAKESRIYTVFGMPFRVAGKLRNSAFAVGPDGAVLTRYDQVVGDRPSLFESGSDPRRMWFRVNGVPAVVTVGEECAWNEIAELAAVAGAQVHVHMDHDPASGPAARLRRMQVWAAMASFKTFTPTVNAAPGGGSAIWDDLRGIEEARTVVRALKPTPGPPALIDSPFSANCVVEAGDGERIIYASRRVNRRNPHRGAAFNPRLAPWFAFGAKLAGAGQDF